MVVSCGTCSVTFCTGAGNGYGGGRRGSAEDCWIASSRTVLRTSVLLEPVTLSFSTLAFASATAISSAADGGAADSASLSAAASLTLLPEAGLGGTC